MEILIVIIVLVLILFTLLNIGQKLDDIRNLVCNISMNSDSSYETIIKIYMYFKIHAKNINGIDLEKAAKEYLDAKEHLDNIMGE